MAIEGTGAGANRDDRPNMHVNQPVPDDGTYITKAYNYGLTQSQDPTQQFLAAENWRLKNEPGYQPAKGFKVQNGQVVYDQGSWLANNWGLLVAGGLLGVGAYAAIAGGAGASAGVGLGETGATTGLTSGAGVGGAAGAGGTLASTSTVGAIGSLAPALDGGYGTGAGLLGGGGSGVLGTAGKIARIGDTVSSLAQGRAQGRVQEAEVNQAQDRNAINAAQVNLSAGQKRGAQSVQGDVMSNAQPFQWITRPDGHSDFTGGLSPAIFSDTTRQLGTQLSSDALKAQQTDHGNPAQVTPLPQAGVGDNILSTAGTIASLYDAYKGDNGGYLSLLRRYRNPGNAYTG